MISQRRMLKQEEISADHFKCDSFHALGTGNYKMGPDLDLTVYVCMYT